MSLKNKQKHLLLSITILIIGILLLAITIIPPMITLNGFKPMVEKSIYEQTSVPAKLNGDIHFSLIGGATIVAHDVSVPTAKIGSVMLTIPFHDIFNIKNARLDNTVTIYDAEILIDKLAPASFNHNIEIYNSNIDFMGRKFHIVRADFTDGEFHGTIRSENHKYDVEFIGDTFHIKNKNNNLEIVGQIYSDGSIRGHMSLETTNINEWFGFSEPKINYPVHMTANFEWYGDNGYKFTNIISDSFSGNFEMLPNGDKIIQLVSNNANFDFTFLLKPNNLLTKTNLKLDLYGDLKFANYKFNHLKIDAISTKKLFQITNIIADNIAITGGTITDNGAKNIMITMPINGVNSMCVFSGTPTKWDCSKFTYGDMSGSLSVDGNRYNITVKSDTPMPSNEVLMTLLSKLGTHGVVNFEFSDISGRYEITKSGIKPYYTHAENKTLKWLNINIPFLPSYMLDAHGNFNWTDDMLTFTPDNKEWQLSFYDNYFYLTGTSYKSWLPNIDLRFIQDGAYIASGFYKKDKISNFKIELFGHEFSGSVTNKNITLHTDVLNIDKFINPEFITRFSEQEFLTNDPIMTLFNLPVNIALSANKLIYENNEYNNFVYSLKPKSQIFSITDSMRGNLLATIDKDNTNYDIFIQLNNFLTNGNLLSNTMPLNVRDTSITAEIALKTYGQIAHDIYYNMTGTLDMLFNGGYLIGMSFDKFYASAENITSLNAEYILSDILTSGETRLKQMHVIGEYDRGNFITTKPIELLMRHTNAIGGLAITDGSMTAEFDLTIRGTAPTPVTISLGILPNNTRQFSLSEIIRDLDPSFMRAFVKTHDKF